MDPNDQITTLTDAETVILRANQTDAGTRLDAFLAAHIEGWSRARLQRLIEDEEVLVNGKTAKASYKLQPDDELEVELTPPTASAFTAEAIPLEIIYEDEEIIVVKKTEGMVV